MRDNPREREPLSVRVLIPDGGELEEPEEEETEEEETEEEKTEMEEDEEGTEEQADEDAEEEEQAEGEEEEQAEGEEGEDEKKAEDEKEEETEGEEDERSEKIAEEGTRLVHLNLDGLFLDLLGLEVDLNEVTLNVTASPGDGKLLGNLLSAVGGLLDTPNLGDLLGLGGDGEEGEGGAGLSGLLPSLPSLNPMERARNLASWLADRIRDLFGNILNSLPLEELLSQFLEELVSQLVDGGNGNGNGDEDAAGS